MLKRLFFLWMLTAGLMAQDLKIASYNVFFLDAGISDARKQHLESVIQHLDADIIAFEEVDDKAALTNILPDSYAIAMLDNPDEMLETALAVRKPLKIVAQKYVFPGEKYDYAFPRTRDLLQVKVLWNTDTLVFLVHHAKSRRGGRIRTDSTRVAASKLIVHYIRENLAGKPVILFGDFNDNPDDRSLNILESGNPDAKGGIDHYKNEFMVNITETLLDSDFCSYGFHENRPVINGETYIPAISGSRKENNKWRNKKYNYQKDIKIKAILLDQILVSPNLVSRIAHVDVYKQIDAITGDLSKIRFRKGKLIYTYRGDLASDHVPVYMILKEKNK